MEDELTFVIHPEAEFASVDLLWESLEDIARLLVDVDRAMYGPKSKHLWYVGNIQSSDPTITVRPDPQGKDAVSVVGAGLRTVTAGTDRPPPHFSEQALTGLRKMTRLFRGGSKARSIAVSVDGLQTATIRSNIGQQVDRILTASYHNLGSLEGTLEFINVHGAPTITIWERVSGSPVRCHIPRERAWVELVKSLLEKRVRVAGHIRYFANGAPRSVSDVSDIEDATQNPGLPKAAFGSIPDAQVRELGAAKWLNAIRVVRRPMYDGPIRMPGLG